VGFQAVDRLRLRLQGPQARRVGTRLSELFFLDEVTALAAGHRPCFECRRAEAEKFRALFGGRMRVSAPQMDVVLHRERLDGRGKRLCERAFDQLPDGAMIAMEGRACAVSGGALLPWRFEGYGPARKRPRVGVAQVLTPPSILRVLAAGYRPRWAGAAAP
jgi:hypothetical protein